MNLGEKLLELRKSKNLSQEEVANKLNVSRQTISKWETDQSLPDIDKIVPMCELYGITSDELLTGKKSENKENNISDDDREIRARNIGKSVMLYILSIVCLMISTEIFKLNDVISVSIFLLICAYATYLIVYTSIKYKKEKVKKEKDKVLKQIDDVTAIFFLIIYLLVSFTTEAWHITWIIWIIYALVSEIIKLIFSLKKEDKDE